MGNEPIIDTKKDLRSANANVIVYDIGLITKQEARLNFLKVKMIVKGAIFGTDNSELFKKIIKEIKKAENPPSFALITSGSLAEQILPEIHEEEFIKDILIFCFQKNKYLKLKTQFQKIKMIESLEFGNILKYLKTLNYVLSQDISGSKFLKNEPLIIFKEYEEYFYQYHHIIAKNFCNEKALSLDKNDITNFLKCVPENRKDEAKKILYTLINNKNFHENIIKVYTLESPICYVLNKELRQLNEKTYNFIRNYACSTLYSLYKYYHNKEETGKVENKLYRALNLKLADILLYKVCEGEIICYPGFTSVCIRENTPGAFDKEEVAEMKERSQTKEDLLLAQKMQDEDERLPSPMGQEIAYEGENIVDCVDIIIENNNPNSEYPSAINISALSAKKAEEERLFPAFSFFKIKKVELLEGSKQNPHKIFLEVVNRKYNLERRIFRGERVYLDSATNTLMARQIKME